MMWRRGQEPARQYSEEPRDMIILRIDEEPLIGKPRSGKSNAMTMDVKRTYALPAADPGFLWDNRGTQVMTVRTDRLLPGVTVKLSGFAEHEDAPLFVQVLAPLVPEITMEEILATVAEGFCPAHRIPLEDDGGELVPWCGACGACWCCGTPPLSLGPSRGGFTVSRMFFDAPEWFMYAGELRVGTA